MADIRPFRAWRYCRDYCQDIGTLTAPLFDVVSDRQRQELYKRPYNSIHLSSPFGEDPAASARHTLRIWKQKNILRQDIKPAIYVYYQYFNLHNDPKTYCRKGFVAFMQIYDWDEKVLLRHENTIPKAVESSVRLLEATELNASPTHGLYTDPDYELEPYMDAAIKAPVYETEDYQGVRDAMAIIDDPDIVAKFVAKLKGKQVILADGHHRYESSLIHYKRHGEKRPGSRYHMMYFTNTEADDLRVLPTHRLVRNLPDLDETAVMERAAQYFDIKPVAEPFGLPDMIAGKQWAFGVAFKGNSYKVRLKPEAFDSLDWNFPPEVKEIDLTVLHFFFIDKALGIAGKDQRGCDNLKFERNFAECLTEVLSGQSQIALIVNEIPVETIKKVCYSGYTMPMKSTFFYPKVIAGFLFGSIAAGEY